MLQQREAVIHEVEAFAQKFIAVHYDSDEETDFRSLESMVWELARILVTALFSAMLLRTRQRLQKKVIAHCGKPMFCRGVERRCLSLAYGQDITTEREVWECSRCRKTLAPLDQALGLQRDSWSPRLREYLCLGAALLPGQRAADFLGRLLGRRIAKRSLMDVAEKMGTTEAANQAARGAFASPYKPEKRQRWYVMFDGSASHVDHAWHEAQLGVVFPEDARVRSGRRGGKDQYRLKWKRAFGCIRNWDAFSQILTEVVGHLRLADVATEIVVITDGATVLRNVIALVLPHALQILDWYHASEHLWSCAKILFGEGTDATRRWARKYERLLKHGQVSQVITMLKRAKPHHRHKAAQKALDDLIRYYRNNAHRMAYDVYRKKGLLIGSGPIEGSHRQIHHQRFKLAGMRRWHRESANALLNLRLIYLNNDWDAFWQKIPSTLSS